MGLIDSHIHLDDLRYQRDRVSLIERAKKQGVTGWIVPAVNTDRFDAVLALQDQYTRVALGLHPYWIADHHESDLMVLEEVLDSHDVIAVGECGLDYFIKELDRDKQLHFFDAQIEIAKDRDLPLILHVRGAVDAVFERLKAHGYYRAVMHSFSGSVEQVQQMVNSGVYLGFGAAACNPNAHKLKAALQAVPLDLLMIETDGPDQPFYDRRKQRMLPEHLFRVCEEVAAIKGVTSATLSASNNANIKKLFNL